MFDHDPIPVVFCPTCGSRISDMYCNERNDEEYIESFHCMCGCRFTVTIGIL